MSFEALGRSARTKPKREKLFGEGRRVPLDRNAKARVVHFARVLIRRTQAGRAYGAVTAKALAVLHAILYGFHNAQSGACFPSYERIAERADCARSTVAKAIRALEAAGILTWANRLTRVRVRCSDLLGEDGLRVRVIRTSNAYVIADPGEGRRSFPDAPPRPFASKSDFRSGTSTQDSFSLFRGGPKTLSAGSPAPNGPQTAEDNPLMASLERFARLARFKAA